MRTYQSLFGYVLLLFVSTVSLTSCGQLKELDSNSIISRFQKSESLYSSSMRWGDWSTLLQLIKNKPKNYGKEEIEKADSKKDLAVETATTIPFKDIKNQSVETQEKSVYNNYQKLEGTNGSVSGALNIITAPSEKLLKHLGTIHVKEVHVITSGMTDVSDEGGSARTMYEISYHTENSVKVHKIRHRVNWWYYKEANSWFTNTPLPKEFQLSELEERTIKLSPK